MSIKAVNSFILRAARKSDEMLEPYDGKLSRTVLRRESGSNLADLVDYGELSRNLGGTFIDIGARHVPASQRPGPPDRHRP